MNCSECKNLLIEYTEGLLDGHPKEGIEQHFQKCPQCRKEVENIRVLQDRIKKNSLGFRSIDFEDRVMDRIARERNIRLKAASSAGFFFQIRSLLMNNKMAKFGTAFVVVIVVVVAFQFFGNPFGPQLTFASVIKPILNAKTAAYDIVVGPDDGSTPVFHQAVKDSRIRSRAVGQKMVNIIDLEKERMLILNEASMDALYVDVKGSSPIQNYLEIMKNTISTLENNPDFTVKDLGRKQLDGKEVVGFFASRPGVDITAWADVDTGLPVRVEQNLGQLHRTFKNIEFDLPMEKDLFSMEVPPGYTVQEPMNLTLQPSEEDFIKGLGLTAEKLNYGLFPDDVSMDYFYKWMNSGSLAKAPPPSSTEEAIAVASDITNGSAFILFFPGEGEWTYRGKGVRLGETETPIFWYRPKGSETYRVIYGDLHVEDVYPEDLPK